MHRKFPGGALQRSCFLKEEPGETVLVLRTRRPLQRRAPDGERPDMSRPSSRVTSA